MIQEEALALLSANHGGLLLVDGALAVSFDTPVDYLLGLIKTARNNRIDICAVSQKSRITIGEYLSTLFLSNTPHLSDMLH